MDMEQPNRPFSEKVTQDLTADIRELWVPMADYFERDGPDAVKTYLDAERSRLEGSVKNLLDQFNRS